HNHPFDKWTQMQFYQMAAFTYGVVAGDYSDGTSAEARNLMREEELALRASFPEPKRPRKEKGMSDADYKALAAAYDKERKKNQDAYNAARSEMRQEQRNYNNVFTDIRNTMRYTSVTVRDRDLRLPHDYQYDDAAPKSSVAPAAMMGHAVEVNPTETPLQAYARWMTDANNPRFTSVIVNRLWKRAFGLALIEPLDELMEGTVPMIPELQTHLEDLMKRVGYDMRAFQQILFNTRTYQAQATRDEISPGTQYHFTGPLLRRMGAEQMWDSFVTLINPNPDMPNQAERERAASVILAAKKTADAVDSLSAEEYLNGVRTAARVYDANREQTEALQKVYLTARTTNKDIEQKYRLADADGKKALQAELDASREEIKDLRGKINVVQRAGRQMTQQAVLLPGIRKLYEKVTGKPAPTDGNPSKATSASSSGEPSMTADSSMMMADAGSKTKEIAIPGYDRRAISPEAKKAAAEEEEAAFREEAAFFGVTDKEFKTYSRARKDQMRNFLRAAEIDSPAPRGHYLREFGQSDRETIENANNEASVPQALAMMNGQLLPQILSPYSQLMLTLRKAQYPDDQLEAAYLAILSRPPTDVERQTWLTAQSRGLDSTEDLIFALLNTQQFIFIQ
ncbi:MAG: DUF1553 domain-containing protein, partial [Verrucomicrobiales bacterium]|nr:DUF1553 domain-containing protein [Verrucomicrobiales bacterium]